MSRNTVQPPAVRGTSGIAYHEGTSSGTFVGKMAKTFLRNPATAGQTMTLTMFNK